MKLSVYSDGTGRGTTFTLLIPASSVKSREADLLPLSHSSSTSSLSHAVASHNRLKSDRGCDQAPQLSVSVDSKDDISDWVSEGDVRSFKNSEIRESQAFEDGDKIISDISPLLLESRVLIVDDSAMNRKMMFVSLQTRFDEILQAEDGVQAVAVVTTRLGTEALPQVILMDFMMPHMNGPAATAEIRAMGYTGVIVGVTGNTLQNDIDEFLRNGVNRVLPKPLDVDTLEMVLRG